MPITVVETPEPHDPEVTPELIPGEPTKVSTRRAIKDSDPLEEKDWLSTPVERPYGDAISPAHREYLQALSIPVEPPTEK